MLVKNWMSKIVLTVDENESMSRAIKMMKEYEIRMLPVLKKGKLTGIVTDRDLKRASASDAITLEVHELLYLLSKIKVKTIMTKNPVTVPTDFTVEETAEILLNHKISGTPVVNDKGKGEGFTVNVPLGKGHGDGDFTRIICHLVLPLAGEYRPEMILAPCGFDLYLHDRLGGMRVTPEGYALITRLLIETAETVCDGHIAFIAEGGYSMKGTRECGLRVMQELCGVPTLNGKKIEKIKNSPPSRFSGLKKVMEVQKKYWQVFK